MVVRAKGWDRALQRKPRWRGSCAWCILGSRDLVGTEQFDALADIRRQHALHGSTRWWGPGLLRQVGDRCLSLPIGKVWVQTVLITPPQGEKLYGPNKPRYLRNYVLNRGTTRKVATGAVKQHFTAFQVMLTHTRYRARNAQIAAIMRSIRFVS